MAYANLVKVSCANLAEMFCRTRDFLCKRFGTYDYSLSGIGWTIHDSRYAVDEDNPAINDYVVIKSTGESGDEDLYFKFVWTSSTAMSFVGYQSWDASTHAGANDYGGTTSWTVAASDAPFLWIYGDLDSFTCLKMNSGGTYVIGVTVGKLDLPFEGITGEVATCTSTLTAGTDVSIVVDTVPSNWEVDRELFIRTTHTNNTSTVKIEKITIKTIVGNTITADLTNSYTANSKLTDFLGYMGPENATFAYSGELINLNGALNTAQGSVYNSNIVSTNTDPGLHESRYIIGELMICGSYGFSGKFENICRIYNTSLTHEDVLEDIDGVEWRYLLVYNNIPLVFKEV